MTDPPSLADGRSLRPTEAARRLLGRAERAVRSGGRAMAESHPALRRPILDLWDAYIRTYVGFRSGWDALRYARRTSLAPFRVVRVDPARIEFVVEADGYPEQTRGENVFPTPKFKHAGTVRDGAWDRTDRRFEKTDVYRAFAARFLHDVPWEETRFYRRSVAYIEEGVTMWDCTTEAEFRRRCEDLDELHDAIASEGYLTQLELAARGDDATEYGTGAGDGLSPSQVVRLVNDELTVAVGRDGDLLFVDGRNRLAIAKVLDLDAVPVWIMTRHERWQRFRERVAADTAGTADLPARLWDHPDLRPIAEEDETPTSEIDADF